MRLTCPNCGAEYEVPDEVIPTTGRDVQCSNCGDTWYQYHLDHMPEGAEEENALAEDPALPEKEPEQDPADTELPAMPDISDPEIEDEDTDDLGLADLIAAEDAASEEDTGDVPEDDDPEDEQDAPPAPGPSVSLRRRELAPEVQSILREEAEYEERVRGMEQDPLESQPDLGLGEPEPVRREDRAGDRLARLRDQDRDEGPGPAQDPEEAAAAAAGSSRRNLLPDIEEINSTLRRKGDTGRTAADARVTRQQRSSTRRSFVAVLALLAVGAILYLQAPAIGNAIPQLKGAMTTYVDLVDRGRGWLDTKASALAEKLDEMANETPAETGTGN
ncbi:zinc-ribbon domain-containing protein [Pseudooceanicola sp.]|uniref:zinc-ribbon domain-containing protein n=1 Tax=Pseudooceanicola sp. TaxID=1914328 RepID=UPI0035C6D864